MSTTEQSLIKRWKMFVVYPGSRELVFIRMARFFAQVTKDQVQADLQAKVLPGQQVYVEEA